MSEIPLQDALRRTAKGQRSYVGELTYAAEEDLSRSFGKFRATLERDGSSTQDLLDNLEAFGEALHRVEEDFHRVSDYYRRLRLEAMRVCLQEVTLSLSTL